VAELTVCNPSRRSTLRLRVACWGCTTASMQAHGNLQHAQRITHRANCRVSSAEICAWTQRRANSHSKVRPAAWTTEVRVRLVSLEDFTTQAFELGVSRTSHVLHIEACCRALSPKPYTVVSEC